jgi:hypothetical protein
VLRSGVIFFWGGGIFESENASYEAESGVRHVWNMCDFNPFMPEVAIFEFFA